MGRIFHFGFRRREVRTTRRMVAEGVDLLLAIGREIAFSHTHVSQATREDAAIVF